MGRGRTGAEEEGCELARLRSQASFGPRGQNGRPLRTRSQAEAEDAKTGWHRGREAGAYQSWLGNSCPGGARTQDHKTGRENCASVGHAKEKTPEGIMRLIHGSGVIDGATVRRHIGMGLSQLEARVLSSQTSAEEFSAVLRHPTKRGRGEFHFSAAGERDYGPEVDCRNTGRLPFQRESPPSHYSYQTSEED